MKIKKEILGSPTILSLSQLQQMDINRESKEIIFTIRNLTWRVIYWHRTKIQICPFLKFIFLFFNSSFRYHIRWKMTVSSLPWRTPAPTTAGDIQELTANTPPHPKSSTDINLPMCSTSLVSPLCPLCWGAAPGVGRKWSRTDVMHIIQNIVGEQPVTC